MIEKLRENFNKGVEKLKWFAQLLDERLKVEITFFKFASKVEKLRKEKEELARAVGERVFEERQQLLIIARDENLKGMLKEMELVDEELSALVEQTSKIGKE
ncbi:MAG: hypothetical protein M0Z75_16015 [Nitrospiraceae bacterium]|nr:hypothetical protein [Nitrospiraceae bacterium]